MYTCYPQRILWPINLTKTGIEVNCLLQRVLNARVEVSANIVGQIESGLLVFVGIEQQDDKHIVKKMAEKIIAYRLFADENHKMNLNVQEAQGDILLVSQFTLAANTRKGMRPSFSTAAKPEISEPLFMQLSEMITTLYKPPQMGVFGADMQVSLCNDGPVSFVLSL